eukprot:Skav233039  [mRNA]  locus=scaffold909:1129822:1131210:+ [translate_table: standard]
MVLIGSFTLYIAAVCPLVIRVSWLSFQLSSSSSSRVAFGSHQVNSRPAMPPSERRSYQNFENLPDLLTEDIWDALGDVNRTRAEQAVLSHGWLLGMRCPSEGSYGVIANLLALTDPQKKQMSTFEKYGFIASIKKNFKKFKKLKKSDDMNYEEYMETLPSNLSSLPDEYVQRAFSEKQPVPCRLPKDDLLMAMGATKLRYPEEIKMAKSNEQQLSASEQREIRLLEAAFKMGQNASSAPSSAASSSGSQARPPSRELLALGGAPVPDSSSVPTASPVEPLAIQDMNYEPNDPGSELPMDEPGEEDANGDDAKPNDETMPKKVPEAVQRLQDALHARKIPKTAEKGETPSSLKRPAAAMPPSGMCGAKAKSKPSQSNAASSSKKAAKKQQSSQKKPAGHTKKKVEAMKSQTKIKMTSQHVYSRAYHQMRTKLESSQTKLSEEEIKQKCRKAGKAATANFLAGK